MWFAAQLQGKGGAAGSAEDRHWLLYSNLEWKGLIYNREKLGGDDFNEFRRDYVHWAGLSVHV